MLDNKIKFYNSKKQKIVGLYSSPNEDRCPIVMIVHGFKGDKEYYPFVNNSVKSFLEAGIAVIRIDCRGSGESDMEFKYVTIESEAEDVRSTVEFVKTLREIDSRRIGVIGVSMGATASLLAARNISDIKALIFWGPMFFGINYYDTPKHRKTIEKEGVFYVSQKLTGKKMIAGKRLFEALKNLDTSAAMREIKIPSLIIRGSKEEVIDAMQDKKAIELLHSDYQIIKNGDHNFTDKNSEKELIETTINWCKEKLIK